LGERFVQFGHAHPVGRRLANQVRLRPLNRERAWADIASDAKE
jgi:hypothetical protein